MLRIGNTELSFISDGTLRLDGGAFFGVVPKPLWRNWLPPDRRNRVELGLNCLLVKTNGKTILLDTGAGNKHLPRQKAFHAMKAGQLIKNLQASGVAPEDIDIVALTHLHFDHAGGCTNIDDKGVITPTFPKATYLVQQLDWNEAIYTNERTRSAYYEQDFLPLQTSGQLTLINGDAEIAPGIWLKHTGGHTAGHQIIYIDSLGQRAASLGDILGTRHHLPPHYTTAWDLYPTETIEKKRDILSKAEKEGWLLTFCHGLDQKAGYLTRYDGKVTLIPHEL